MCVAVLNVNEENFKKEIESGLVLVDFYADWCGPCKMLAPVLDELAGEVDGLKVVKVNVDESRAIAAEYKVSSIPNLTLIKDGVTVSQEMGFKPKEILKAWIESNKA